MKKIVINFLIFGFIAIPFLMLIIWFAKPKVRANVLIVDKSELSIDKSEHSSFRWILNHNKYVKENGSSYGEPDFFAGFLPNKSSVSQVDSLGDISDMVYYIDTYGKLDDNDLLFIKKMREKGKLVMAQFNFAGIPTLPLIKQGAEKLFGMKWSGWTGRYYGNLDVTSNPELPAWVVTQYKEQHHKKWPFKTSGVIFVNENGLVEVLENKVDLKSDLPVVRSFDYGIRKFGIPKSIVYPYWFEITLSSDFSNRVVSYFEIMTTERGDSILRHHNIPKIFPAVYENITKSPFYYFCGDFSDAKKGKGPYQFVGIEYFKMFALKGKDPEESPNFFWLYYLPMTTKIFEDFL